MDKLIKDFSSIAGIEELIHHPNLFNIPYQEIQDLQLKLLQRKFAENYKRIPALRRASDHRGIQSIEQIRDVVGLLFSHTTYKSYPESFLDKGQWDKMNQWMATLSTRGDELKRIDVSGVRDLDGWLSLLDTHGFALCHSSGSSGKPSFFPKSTLEQTMTGLAYSAVLKLGQGVDPEIHKMPVFCITFKSGWGAVIRRNQELARIYALAPDMVEYAFNETQSVAATRHQQKMSKLAREGKLTSDELAGLQKLSQEKQVASASAFHNFVQRILAYKGQRVMILGHTATVFQAAAKGLEMGEEAVFASDSLVIHGGGKKGAKLPENYEDIMEKYYGVAHRNCLELYGMTERNSTPLVCEYNRKHCPPWEIPLLLDREGQELLNGDFSEGGTITGRYAFFDLLASTYWGGITTGDRVKMSFDRCPCNREGPQILEITRYADLPDAPDEDKLSCAAEMTSYVFAEITANEAR